MMHHPQHHLQIKLATTVGCIYMLVLPISGLACYAQGADGYTSLRTPFIDGALVTPPNTCAPEGAPPPMGDGMVPDPVNPGMGGAPGVPASQVPMPILPAGNKQAATAAFMPYWSPPTDIQVSDPGPLSGAGGLNMYPPPAAQVNLPAGGGQLPDQAPTWRMQSQKTQDLGNQKNNTSQLFDFGHVLKNVAVAQPVQSQDGPRPTASGGYASGYSNTTAQASSSGGINMVPNRAPNLLNAWDTQNLYGNRQLFVKNDNTYTNVRPKMTIAPN